MIRVFSGAAPSSSPGNPKGSWMMRKRDFEKYKSAAGGNSRKLAKLIANKLALERVPTHFVQIKVPPGTKINISFANAQTWGGGRTGGGIQVQVVGRVRDSWLVSNPKEL